MSFIFHVWGHWPNCPSDESPQFTRWSHATPTHSTKTTRICVLSVRSEPRRILPIFTHYTLINLNVSTKSVTVFPWIHSRSRVSLVLRTESSRQGLAIWWSPRYKCQVIAISKDKNNLKRFYVGIYTNRIILEIWTACLTRDSRKYGAPRRCSLNYLVNFILAFNVHFVMLATSLIRGQYILLRW